MGKFNGYNYKKLSKIISSFGFILKRQSKGSHEIWYNEKTKKFTTLINHGSKDIKEGTIIAILKQAGIDQNEFLNK